MRKTWLLLTAAVLVVAAVFLSVYPIYAAERGKGADRVLSKITFIHFKKGHAKPPWAGGGKPGDKEDEGDYTYLSKGAKWKAIEDYRLNTDFEENIGGSLDALVINSVLAGMDEWETPDSSVFDIFGGVVLDGSATYDDGAYRGYNTISFGNYGNPEVIGEASVWGYFTGPPEQREIIEAHIIFNDECEWGDASGDLYLMDIQNIATHELGHCAGMGDLYKPGASEETMYGYSEEGETKKRDLYIGDIAGIIKLYE